MSDNAGNTTRTAPGWLKALKAQNLSHFSFPGEIEGNVVKHVFASNPLVMLFVPSSNPRATVAPGITEPVAAEPRSKGNDERLALRCFGDALAHIAPRRHGRFAFRLDTCVTLRACGNEVVAACLANIASLC